MRRYSYAVRAIDSAGHQSALTSPISVDVVDPSQISGPDTQPPSTPTGLTATALGNRRVQLSWQASTDDRPGTITYKVFRGKKRSRR